MRLRLFADNKMFRNLLAVLGLASAAAFSPAAVSRVAMSRVVQPAAQFALAPLAEVSMSAVTEYDKDGNPVTHYEMYAPAACSLNRDAVTPGDVVGRVITASCATAVSAPSLSRHPAAAADACVMPCDVGSTRSG